MNYFWIFFIIRIFILIPLTSLVVCQLINILKRGFSKDRLAKTRIFLFVISAALWLESALYFTDGIADLFFGYDRQQFIQQNQWTLVFIRAIMLAGVWMGYNIVYGSTKSKRS